MDEIYAFAKNEKKPLFVLIGQGHFDDIRNYLEEKGIPIKAYPSSLVEDRFSRELHESVLSEKELKENTWSYRGDEDNLKAEL